MSFKNASLLVSNVTFEHLLKKATQMAVSCDKEIEAVKLLLMHYSNYDAHAFYMHLKQTVPQEIETQFQQALNQYLYNHIPVQQLIGHAYFYGYAFFVSSDVLIPRSETEQLVEHVLHYYDTYFADQHIDVLDLGTGSGCIGITLDLEAPQMHVTCSDISQKALDVANENIKALKSNATTALSDLFNEIKGAFDIIISNPPYIPLTEVVDPMVLNEPHVALYGGDTGVEFYARILRDAKSHLKPKALLAFEHGYQQKQMIYDDARRLFPHATIIQKKDLQGKDRFTFIGIGGVLK